MYCARESVGAYELDRLVPGGPGEPMRNMTQAERAQIIDDLVGDSIPFVCNDPTDKVCSKVLAPASLLILFCSRKRHSTILSSSKWQTVSPSTGRDHSASGIHQDSMDITGLCILRLSAQRYFHCSSLQSESHHALLLDSLRSFAGQGWKRRKNRV